MYVIITIYGNFDFINFNIVKIEYSSTFGIFAGSSLYGFLDNWTGKVRESKSIQIPSYNTTTILNSKVSQSLRNIGQLLLSEDGIKTLRQQSRIICHESKKTSTKFNAKCSPYKKPCIFNVQKDPCEMKNLYIELQNTGVIEDLENRLKMFKQTMIMPNNKRTDVRANPKLYNNTWVCWDDFDHQNLSIPQPYGLFSKLKVP